ncbi:guanine nucleotide-binding protein subunit alpha-12-like [Misgurnus anguillicaudatus]|uniref:guanine nucleotide-binding protein subunit alpha-12-like n=1 Tax=Misgurnus anguillicaudatus TaxID=75329 RepID=UPI003CCFC02B
MSKKFSWSFLPTVSSSKQERVARQRSRKIDVMLKRGVFMLPEVLFVVGNSQSGVSTFLKQMRIITGPEFSQQELIDFRRTIYKNIIEGLQVLVIEKISMGIPWGNPANENNMLVTSVVSWNMNLEPEKFQGFVTAINSLWNDSGIQEAYSKTKKIYFLVTYESLKYFLNNMNRIGQLSYIPCKQDILYARNFCTASGYFVHRNILITRSRSTQRFHGSHNTTVLFMVASSEFDQVMEVPYSSNGSTSLADSLEVFKVVLCHSFFRKCTTLILFFNKTDLLAEKVQTADIRKYFPEFQGDPHSLEDVQRFLVECFRERMMTVDNSRPFFYHFTTAVDTENIRIAFDSVKETILREKLKALKLL